MGHKVYIVLYAEDMENKAAEYEVGVMQEQDLQISRTRAPPGLCFIASRKKDIKATSKQNQKGITKYPHRYS